MSFFVHVSNTEVFRLIVRDFAIILQCLGQLKFSTKRTISLPIHFHIGKFVRNRPAMNPHQLLGLKITPGELPSPALLLKPTPVFFDFRS